MFARADQSAVLLNGALQLALSKKLSALTSTELAAKFPRRAQRPLAAYADRDGNATLAVTLARQSRPVTQQNLRQILANTTQTLPKLVPGMTIRASELVELAGRHWARITFSAPAADNTTVFNDMFLTSFRGELLGVNLSATTDRWPQSQPTLSESLLSISIRECLENFARGVSSWFGAVGSRFPHRRAVCATSCSPDGPKNLFFLAIFMRSCLCEIFLG